MVRAMTRLIALFFVLPSVAAADWSPRPSAFSYDATFATCLLDPGAPDLAGTCAEAMNAAFALKRAVARAAVACHPQDLATCAAPFEDEGLPAIAVRIAADVGCEASDPRAGNAAPLGTDHCITIASDIMIDEGVVPLDTSIGCEGEATDCRELAMLHASLWMEAADALAEGDPTIADLQARNFNDCFDAATATGVTAELTTMGCIAERSAALWADLIQTEQDN